MAKKIRYKGIRDVRKRANIRETAAITNLSESTVEKVLNTDRNNETVVFVYMTLKERHDEVFEEMMKGSHNWTTIFNRSPKTSAN